MEKIPFDLRQTTWPSALPSPPATWAATWDSYVREHDIPWTELNAADDALAAFWEPVLTNARQPQEATWDAVAWSWSAG